MRGTREPVDRSIRSSDQTRKTSRFRRLAKAAVWMLPLALLVAGVVVFVTFDDTDQAKALGEPMPPGLPEPGGARHWEAQVGVSPYSAVNTRTGNVITRIPIVGWSGAGPALNMTLYHNSAAATSSVPYNQGMGFDMGPGWTLSYSSQVLLDDPSSPSTATVIHDDAGRDIHTYFNEWNPPAGVHDTLIEKRECSSTTTTECADDGDCPGIETCTGAIVAFELRALDLSYLRYEELTPSDDFFRIRKVVDRFGNVLEVVYDEHVAGSWRVDYIKDEAGRKLEYDYDSQTGQLTGIKDPKANIEGSGNEASFSNLPTNRVWNLAYDSAQSDSIVRIEDSVESRIHVWYDTDGRIRLITDKMSQSQQVPDPILQNDEYYQHSYDVDGRLTTVDLPLADSSCDPATDPRCEPRLSVTFELFANEPDITHGHVTDVAGNEWQFWYASDAPTVWPDGNLYSVVNPLGHGGNLTWDTDRNLVAVADVQGQAWNMTYDSDGNLLTLTNPLGHELEWTFGAYGNVETLTDALNHTVTFGYDDHPVQTGYPTLLTSITDPNGGVTKLWYHLSVEDMHGKLAQLQDPNGVFADFGYDEWGQLTDYGEGRYPGGGISAIAACPNCYTSAHTTVDSGGRSTESSASGGAAGVETSNNENHSTGSTCEYLAGGIAAPPPSPNGHPGIPSTAPTVPVRHGEHDADHLPNCLLDSGFTPTWHQDPDDPGAPREDEAERTIDLEYDGLNRVISKSLHVNELGHDFTRLTTHDYRADTNEHWTKGPDEIETYVRMNSRGLVEHVRRGDALDPVMTVDYVYDSRGLLTTQTRSNDTKVEYEYDNAHRLTAIDHLKISGVRLRRFEYTYYDNDPVYEIKELVGASPNMVERARTTFYYDPTGRLTREVRTIEDPYDITYVYDLGGNRTHKTEVVGTGPSPPTRTTEYFYDWDTQGVYLTNRILSYTVHESGGSQQQSAMSGGPGEVEAMPGPGGGGGAMPMGPGGGGWGGGGLPVLMESGWYYYHHAPAPDNTPSGNVERVVVKDETQQVPIGQDPWFSSTRLSYAKNGSAVTFVSGEQWQWDEDAGAPYNYNVTYAREFRYDRARQRYLSRPLNTNSFEGGNIETVGTVVWTDYIGDWPYGDYTVSTGGLPPTSTATETKSYALGTGTFDWSGGLPDSSSAKFFAADMIGTTRFTTDSTASEVESAAYTAFGERVAGSATRYGYAGAWGYQTETFSGGGGAEFPFQHVGHRYYEAATGRFVQRDPIGILDGFNVYAYGASMPTVAVDPDGLFWGAIAGAIVGGVVGAVTGGAGGGVAGFVSSLVGGAITGALVGSGVTPALAGAIGGAIGGAAGGALGAALNGGDLEDMALAAAAGGVIGGAAGGLGGGLGGRIGQAAADDVTAAAAAQVVGAASATAGSAAGVYIVDIPSAIICTAKKMQVPARRGF